MSYIRMRIILALLVSMALTGCANLTGVSPFSPSDDKVTSADRATQSETLSSADISGPSPTVQERKVLPINLFIMLDEGGQAKTLYETELQTGAVTRPWADLRIDEEYEWAYKAFALHGTKAKRNAIQYRIKQAADIRCEKYKRLVFLAQANGNFTLGLGSTIAGVLGPLFGERGAKNLAATAGILGGYRAEMNQDYFYNLTAVVITAGIDQARTEIMSNIRNAQVAELDDYNIQKAIDDMIVYDNACSAVSGLQEAQAAIHLVADPGIDAANRILLKANITNQLLQNVGTTDPQKVQDMLQAIQQAQNSPLISSTIPLSVGANTQQAPTGRTPTDVQVSLGALQFNPDTELKLTASSIANAYFSGKDAQADSKTTEDVSTQLKTTSLVDLYGADGIESSFNKVATACSTKLSDSVTTYSTAFAESQAAGISSFTLYYPLIEVALRYRAPGRRFRPWAKPAA